MASGRSTHKDVLARHRDVREGLHKRQESQAALIFVLLIGLFAALGIFLTAQSAPGSEPQRVADCAAVGGNAARLTCFDTLARNADMPFKGAAPTQHSDER